MAEGPHGESRALYSSLRSFVHARGRYGRESTSPPAHQRARPCTKNATEIRNRLEYETGTTFDISLRWCDRCYAKRIMDRCHDELESEGVAPSDGGGALAIEPLVAAKAIEIVAAELGIALELDGGISRARREPPQRAHRPRSGQRADTPSRGRIMTAATVLDPPPSRKWPRISYSVRSRSPSSLLSRAPNRIDLLVRQAILGD
jgi:hypothetical protein